MSILKNLIGKPGKEESAGDLGLLESADQKILSLGRAS
jgi:hypothetical protein